MWFENLKPLLQDMRKKKWLIDSWLFAYNKINTIVILELYEDGDKKPNKHALAEISFYKIGTGEKLTAYLDWYQVHFYKAVDFYQFFNIDRDNHSHGRAVFQHFSEYFAQFIPTQKSILKDKQQENLIISYLNKVSGNGKYCFAVKRNPDRNDGSMGKRSLANRNKAELLRSNLFEKYKKDENISFYFSENPDKEKSDQEIMANFAKNQFN